MEKAREAVAKFTGKHGHTTEVDETVRAAITEEHIKPTRHEEATEAIDREVHQHHHHTTVQPIQHQEVLPEKHHHQMLATEERTFHHDNEEESRARLEQERAQFRDSSITHETSTSASAAPQVMGEHVHHHVHEHVQPIINKETIAPEVVHTTKPVHETHHASSQHHGTSILPTKTLDEFRSGGGVLEGTRGSHTHETYEGVPRSYNREMQQNPTEADMNPGYTGVEAPKSHHTGGTGLSGGEPFTDENPMHRMPRDAGPGTTTGGIGSGMSGQDADYRSGPGSGRHTGTGGGIANAAERYEESRGTGQHTGTGGGVANAAERYEESRGPGHHSGTQGGVGSAAERYAEDKNIGRGSGYNDSSNTTSQKKPSLMDRLNPMKDTDRDGKKGIME